MRSFDHSAWRHAICRDLYNRLMRLVDNQRIRFLAVGAANTVFSTILFAGLVLLFGPEVSPVISLCIAWVVGLLLGFSLHRRLVFRVAGHFWLDLIRFAGVNYLGLGINIGLMVVLVEVVGLPPIRVQVGIVAFMILYSYVGHKFFSFRRRR